MIKQFDVVPNGASGNRKIPFLLVLQHHFLDEAASVVVAPLYSDRLLENLPVRLSPAIPVHGEMHFCAIHLLAAVPRKTLGKAVANALDHRDAIIRAYDVIISGI